MASASTKRSAASTITPPTVGWYTLTSPPARPRSACQACASAQFGRHQNGSSRADRPPPPSSSLSHSAARRSASDPGPRPSNAVRVAMVSMVGMARKMISAGTPSRGASSAGPVNLSSAMTEAEEDALLAVALEAATGSWSRAPSPVRPPAARRARQERTDRPRVGRRHRGRGGDPGRPEVAAARMTRSSPRRAARPPGVRCAGWSTPSTARSTSSSGFPHGG